MSDMVLIQNVVIAALAFWVVLLTNTVKELNRSISAQIKVNDKQISMNGHILGMLDRILTALGVPSNTREK